MKQLPRSLFFDDPLFEMIAKRALLQAVYAGAEFGECSQTASRNPSGRP